MPALSRAGAVEKLAEGVEKVKSTDLAEIYAELFPEEPSTEVPVASDIAKHIRNGLEAEEIVDLWNVVFPRDHNVWYDEEAKEIRYNEEVFGYAD